MFEKSHIYEIYDLPSPELSKRLSAIKSILVLSLPDQNTLNEINKQIKMVEQELEERSEFEVFQADLAEDIDDITINDIFTSKIFSQDVIEHNDEDNEEIPQNKERDEISDVEKPKTKYVLPVLETPNRVILSSSKKLKNNIPVPSFVSRLYIQHTQKPHKHEKPLTYKKPQAHTPINTNKYQMQHSKEASKKVPQKIVKQSNYKAAKISTFSFPSKQATSKQKILEQEDEEVNITNLYLNTSSYTQSNNDSDLSNKNINEKTQDSSSISNNITNIHEKTQDSAQLNYVYYSNSSVEYTNKPHNSSISTMHTNNNNDFTYNHNIQNSISSKSDDVNEVIISNKSSQSALSNSEVDKNIDTEYSIQDKRINSSELSEERKKTSNVLHNNHLMNEPKDSSITDNTIIGGVILSTERSLRIKQAKHEALLALNRIKNDTQKKQLTLEKERNSSSNTEYNDKKDIISDISSEQTIICTNEISQKHFLPQSIPTQLPTISESDYITPKIINNNIYDYCSIYPSLDFMFSETWKHHNVPSSNITEIDSISYGGLCSTIPINEMKSESNSLQNRRIKHCSMSITKDSIEKFPQSVLYRTSQYRSELGEILARVFSNRESNGMNYIELNENSFAYNFGWNLFWSWTRANFDQDRLLVWQKFNHFVESSQLTRKDLLHRNIAKYRRLNTKIRSFLEITPSTYILPEDASKWISEFQPNSLWIMKPVNSSRGRGISLINSVIDAASITQPMIIQKYITNPCLLDGYKFDFRLYLLVTSFRPLEAFLHSDGVARMSTVKFSSDINEKDNYFIHLTNSSVQKANFDHTYKISLLEAEKKLYPQLIANGISWVDLYWKKIVSIILKALLSVCTAIPCSMNSFELFGVDIMLDNNLRPYLLEVNASPDLTCTTDVDFMVKDKVVNDIFHIVDVIPYDKEYLNELFTQKLLTSSWFQIKPKNSEERKNMTNEIYHKILHGKVARRCGELPKEMGNFKRIYPNVESHSIVSTFCDLIKH